MAEKLPISSQVTRELHTEELIATKKHSWQKESKVQTRTVAMKMRGWVLKSPQVIKMKNHGHGPLRPHWGC